MKAGPPRPEVVVFDLGNVFITWDRALLYRSVFDDAEDLERFLTEVYTLEVNERLDRGQSLDDFCAELAAEHPDHAGEILLLRERWLETIGPVIDGSVAVLDELVEAEVPCFALSNWNADTFAMVEAHHPFLERFDGIVLSGREGVTKPDPAIFRLLCDRFAIEPGRAVFFDDSHVNVAAARAFGMDAELFTDPVTLRAAVVARGLLT